ncbi:MAG: hypothetical protein RBJ76_20165 [Stenomitos frigidus ULC029]
MTNSGSSPEPSKKGFKVTLVQGVIGAASLAGTTAIPLMVQRFIAPPTTASSPAPVPAQVSSPSPQMQSTLDGSGKFKASDNDDNDHPGEGKSRKKNKQDD